MAEGWVQVTEDEAKGHSLYGVKGWLLIFEMGHLVNAALAGGGLFVATVNRRDPWILLLLLAWFASSALVVFLCGTRARVFRTVAFWLTVGMATVSILILTASPFFDAAGLITGLVGTVTGIVFWGVYLQRSRRVRVTFESAIRATERKSGKSGSEQN